jgi:hypothetical protein
LREAGREDGEDDLDGVAADVNLREAQRILIDLLELSKARGSASGATASVQSER